jgi:hypothetical protein
MDWIQGERFIDLANNVNIFYRHTHDVNYFFKNLPTNDPFILISHNSDGCIMWNPNRDDHADVSLMPNTLIHWFGQNVNVTSPFISSIPIGLENDKWQKKEQKFRLMKDMIRSNHVKRNLLYINHNVKTNPTEREKPYKILEGNPWVTADHGANGAGFPDYLLALCQHPFIVCPQGHGMDTVRTWEALYMGCIPIEKRNLNNRFYADLPICFVNDWEEITEEFLVRELIRIKTADWNMEKLTFTYWKNLIEGAIQ